VNETGLKNKSDYNNSASNQSNSIGLQIGKVRLNVSSRQRPPRGIDLMENSYEPSGERSGRA